MPRTPARFRAKLRAAAAVKAKKKKKRAGSRLTVSQQLLQQVGECIDVFDFETAERLCRKGLKTNPTNVQILESFGPILLELGKTSEAYDIFTQLVELSPDTSHSKYMYLGQMSSGDEAVGHLQKGIEIMLKEYDSSQPDSGPVMAEEISSAYCALAEVYLTDSCFADKAEDQCHGCCEKALQYAPTSSEAHQLMASYLLSKGNNEEARSVLVKGTTSWLPDNSSNGGEGAACASTSSAAVPSFYTRLNCAKLLMEVEEYEKGRIVLEGLLKDDDEVVAVWYLLGWLQYLTKDHPTAKLMLEEVDKLYLKLGCDDADMLDHTHELLREIASTTNECTPADDYASVTKESKEENQEYTQMEL